MKLQPTHFGVLLFFCTMALLAALSAPPPEDPKDSHTHTLLSQPPSNLPFESNDAVSRTELGLMESPKKDFDTQSDDELADDAPIIAQGRVTDIGGSPLQGAKVTIEHQAFQDVDYWGTFWIRLDDWETETDPYGNFELRGKLGADKYRLNVFIEGYSEKHRKFSVGEKNIPIILQPVFLLSGRVILDPNIDYSLLHLHLIHEEICLKDLPGQIGSSLSSTGEFSMVGIQDKSSLLVLSTKVSYRILYLHQMLSTLIDSNMANQITLPDIDLRGKLNSISLYIVDLDGNPILNSRVWPVGSLWETSLVGDPIVVLYSGPWPGMYISADRMRTIFLERVPKEKIIVLHKGISIKLHMPSGIVIPSGYEIIGIANLLAKGGLHAPECIPVSFTLTNTSESLSLPEPGEYQLQLAVRRTETNSEIILNPSFGPNNTLGAGNGKSWINVLDSPTVQNFSLEMNQLFVDRSILRLQQEKAF